MNPFSYNELVYAHFCSRWVKLRYVYVHSTPAGKLKSRVNAKSSFAMLQYKRSPPFTRNWRLNF